jgi:hypothetical protein
MILSTQIRNFICVYRPLNSEIIYWVKYEAYVLINDKVSLSCTVDIITKVIQNLTPYLRSAILSFTMKDSQSSNFPWSSPFHKFFHTSFFYRWKTRNERRQPIDGYYIRWRKLPRDSHQIISACRFHGHKQLTLTRFCVFTQGVSTSLPLLLPVLSLSCGI